MKRLSAVAVVATIAVLVVGFAVLAAIPAEAGGGFSIRPPRTKTIVMYSVKFLCGQYKRPLDQGLPPLLDPDQLEGPVKPGNYQTAINIHNPNGFPVRFGKKAVLLFPSDAATTPPIIPIPETLDPNLGMEIDCPDIRLWLETSGITFPAPMFIKGWVVLEDPRILFTRPDGTEVIGKEAPLDVVAVYTSHGFTKAAVFVPSDAGTPGGLQTFTVPGGFSIDIERVLPTKGIHPR